MNIIIKIYFIFFKFKYILFELCLKKTIKLIYNKNLFYNYLLYLINKEFIIIQKILLYLLFYFFLKPQISNLTTINLSLLFKDSFS